MNHKGTKVTTITKKRLVFLVCLFAVSFMSSAAAAGNGYVVVVVGASAGAPYAEKYNGWRSTFVTALKEKFGYPDDRVVALWDAPDPVDRSTRENVRRVFGNLRARVGSDDQLFVVLIGHGTMTDSGEAKFNLVGPDLTSVEWADLLKSIRGRIVFVNTTAASFPFIARLSAPGRVVVTATESAAQQFETVFAEHFLKAFTTPAADEDKNGRVSIWEAFSYASTLTKQFYDVQGRLATERPLLDDNGDGAGREAQGQGADGALARTLFLAPEAAATGNPALVSRRAALQRQLDDLRTRKALSPNPAQFDAEIEQLLIEIAQLSRQLRDKQ